MRKGIKISLIVIPLLILTITSGTLLGTISYTLNNVDYTIEDTMISGSIENSSNGFIGSVITETSINVINSGYYKLKNIAITIYANGLSFENDSINFAQKSLLIDQTFYPSSQWDGKNWNGVISMNLTSRYIDILAIEDGNISIRTYLRFGITLGGIYFRKLFTKEDIIGWTAPYNLTDIT